MRTFGRIKVSEEKRRKKALSPDPLPYTMFTLSSHESETFPSPNQTPKKMSHRFRTWCPHAFADGCTVAAINTHSYENNHQSPGFLQRCWDYAWVFFSRRLVRACVEKSQATFPIKGDKMKKMKNIIFLTSCISQMLC